MKNRDAFSIAAIAFLAGIILAAIAIPSRGGGERGSAAGVVAATAGDTSAGDAGTFTTEAPVLPDDAVTGSAAAPPATAGTATVAAGATTATTAGGSSAAGAASTGATPTAAFRGVTDTAVKIGVPTLDSSTLGAVCPRCSNGQAATGAAADALVKAWRRDGLLPINGRDMVVISRKYDFLSAEEARSACIRLAQEDKVFAAVEEAFGVPGDCLAREFRIPVLGGYAPTEKQLRGYNGYGYALNASPDRIGRNFPYFLQKNGLLDGAVIGLYAMNDVGIQQALNGLRETLKRMGHPVVVDMSYDQNNSSATDAIAVQRMRGAGVNTAIIQWWLTEPSGFQKAAAAQLYKPKYPIADFSLAGSDAVADVSYDGDATEGMQFMSQESWAFTSKRPASYANKSGAYCLKAYQEATGRTLDAYDNDSEVRFTLGTCAVLEVMRQALINAGRDLNDRTLIQGMQRINGFEATTWPSVSFSPNKFWGEDLWVPMRYYKNGCPPLNNHFCSVGAPQPFWVP